MRTPHTSRVTSDRNRCPGEGVAPRGGWQQRTDVDVWGSGGLLRRAVCRASAAVPTRPGAVPMRPHELFP
eukprot:351369-Chlamydomonas_euryale.AAC.6